MLELMEEREQTLLDWYERSLIDCSTFDAESRKEIQAIVNDSEDVFGSEEEIREFFTRAIETFNGSIEKRGNQLYEAEMPPAVTDSSQSETMDPFTSTETSQSNTTVSSTSLPTRRSCKRFAIWFSSTSRTQAESE